MNILNDIQALVERSIEKRFYNLLLQEGYTPDRTVYANDPAGYMNQKAVIRADKGFSIDLYGPGNAHDRGNLNVPRIVITGKGFFGGSVGNDPDYHHTYNVDTDSYDKVLGASTSSNYKFEVNITSNKVKHDRVLESVRQLALPNRSYIPFHHNPEANFLVGYNSVIQDPDLSKGIIQKTYNYEAIDVFEQADQIVKSNIAKISEITIFNEEQANNDKLLISPFEAPTNVTAALGAGRASDKYIVKWDYGIMDKITDFYIWRYLNGGPAEFVGSVNNNHNLPKQHLDQRIVVPGETVKFEVKAYNSNKDLYSIGTFSPEYLTP